MSLSVGYRQPTGQQHLFRSIPVHNVRVGHQLTISQYQHPDPH
ncbi:MULTISPECIES: hypothetical protein [Klebsiella]|nr:MULTISPECIES: hypothetical protein [Klebsiella]MDK6227987.1 hypothetical protein [Klebsiella variicola]MDU3694270.1 hypothetical protein [Klebsiella michiganensis]MDU3714939.1 hypothetical protein [Klebsiella michiganensis]MEC6166647.1 hypothetical protein [Klebsiella grimontii]